jgi:hypothetical protein
VEQRKIDHPPLLVAGIHDHTLQELEELTVIPFPNSERRSILFESLKIYIGQFSKFNINIEAWIDGSFVTKKENPDDIDMVVLISEVDVNKLSEDNKNSLRALLDKNTCLGRFNLDVYYTSKENRDKKAYWRGLFGFQRDEVTPKGLVRITCS